MSIDANMASGQVDNLASAKPGIIASVLSPVLWIAVFIVAIGVTQLGSLEHEVLDWDETTFVLMAQDILRGNLPYVAVYDNKPPVLFVALAGWMAIFGESVASFRLFGDLCLLVVCLFTFLIGRQVTSELAAGVGTLFLIALSASGFAQHTQTEHLAMAFLMPAIWLLMQRDERLVVTFLAAILISLAVLTRTNLAYVAVVTAVFHAVLLLNSGFRSQLPHFLAFALGGVLPVVLMFLAYWQAGALDVLILSAVEAPLAYSAPVDGDLLEVLRLHAIFWGGRLLHEPWVFVPATMALGASTVLLGLAITTWPDRIFEHVHVGQAALVAVIGGAVVYSVLTGGAAYPHYWNQVLPFASIFLAVGCALLPIFRISRFSATCAAVIALAGAMASTAPAALRVVRGDVSAGQGHFIAQAAADLRAAGAQESVIWATEYHLVHFYLGTVQPSPMLTHPANIVAGRPVFDTMANGGYVPADTFEQLLENGPDYLVTGSMPPWYLPEDMAARFQDFAETGYSIFGTYGPLTVMKRNPPEIEPVDLAGPARSPGPAFIGPRPKPER